MISDRIAGAPISWGVSEVEGWGVQLPRERVLAEMRDLGISATEFGPDGFLPEDPDEKASFLHGYGLGAVGGFHVTLLHDPGHDPVPEFDRFADACVGAGARVVVLAAHSAIDGYDDRPVLDDAQWSVLIENLERLRGRADERGLLAVVHPHIGTMVETGDDVDRVLASSTIGLCVDTGHLLAAGVDPVALTKSHVARVAHVHLKDVDAVLAARVADGSVPFGDAVRVGLFRPLGEGAVDVAAMVGLLEDQGYEGWYVLEQDVMLDDADPGVDPVQNVRVSLDYLRAVGR